MNKLSIIIVNYNVSYFLEQALLSVQKAMTGLETEVYVVDNNSVDGSVLMVRKRFPWVKLIDNNENVGFSKANNQAIRLSNAEYILLLNPDTVLEEDSLRKCCEFMDQHPQAGALGVKMLDGKGTFLPESKRGLPTPGVAFYKVFGFSKLFPKSKTFGRYHLGFLDENETHEVDVLAGAFMLLRKSVLDKIGLLDEDYFMYGEDIDLSYRVQKAGYKNYYFPHTRIIHYKGESTKRTSTNYVFVFYRAMIIFASKHFSKGNAGLFSFLIHLAIYIRATISIGARLWQRISLPLIDFTCFYVTMTLITDFWVKNFKQTPVYYPDIYLKLIMPLYGICWLVSIYFSGGYDKEFRFYKVVRGALWGTLIISGLSNFFENYRYSKALIILGAITIVTVIFFIRIIKHFITHKNIRLGETDIKRTLLIGEREECERVRLMIDQVKAKLNVVGYLQTTSRPCEELSCLGNIRQMNEAIMIYKIDEIIFCSKDLSSASIIEWMTKVKATGVDFKIVPDESNYIIGSNSKESVGELYTFDVQLSIDKAESIRSKRLFDLSLSLLFLLTLPVHLIFVKNSKKFISNCISVLLSEKTWVGFSDLGSIKIAKLKKGILTTVSGLEKSLVDSSTAKRLDLLYAKEYKTMDDFTIVVKNYRDLGS